MKRLERVSDLIARFETPYGMELLASVHWVAMHDDPPARSEQDAERAVRNWNERKRRVLGHRHGHPGEYLDAARRAAPRRAHRIRRHRLGRLRQAGRLRAGLGLLAPMARSPAPRPRRSRPGLATLTHGGLSILEGLEVAVPFIELRR
ncbi:hypothetical protein CKO25_02560 [Thiocapsa imhoffii]|uniref:Uncharacterized protein n=1 Tax=Thiocapsa imhoffii TaxID=382777 RepID=A0A9X0WFE2_9GAMM|nr:hypothetical protein [Thiocapsa imhoffii]